MKIETATTILFSLMTLMIALTLYVTIQTKNKIDEVYQYVSSIEYVSPDSALTK